VKKLVLAAIAVICSAIGAYLYDVPPYGVLTDDSTQLEFHQRFHLASSLFDFM